ncbi:hypothetical protein JKP88DRAFT_267202 [Tribonema minus]|uniref:Bromo domain-containing protein n=1 Tax=Tribonema minus TaxID=303371 RepID=A0A835Z9M9_9STRA|nr:hypothetical protein JKP88DRAFT_267202 [Tribonema minus]
MSQVFLDPVDAANLDGYSQLIERPMNIRKARTLYTKARNRPNNNPEQRDLKAIRVFMEDLALVFRNAEMYGSPEVRSDKQETVISLMARECASYTYACYRAYLQDHVSAEVNAQVAAVFPKSLRGAEAWTRAVHMGAAAAGAAVSDAP